jgi:hypothetical protein
VLKYIALVCALAACGDTSKTVTNPAAAPASWRELTSEHFVVWTEASPERARVLVRTMENLRQVVLGVSFFKQDVKGKSFVIAFNDIDEVHEYVPKQFIAQAWSGHNVLLQPVIVMAASSLDHDRRVVTHELTHVIAFNAIADQPKWFAEGLAGYFETVRLDEAHAKTDVGMPLQDRLRFLHEHGATPIAELFACKQPACMDERFYATTWALFTYLLNEHQAELFQYMERLIATPESNQDQLWPAVFPALTPAALDHALATWIAYGRVEVRQYNIVLREWPVTERSIAEADVWAAKGILRFLFAHGATSPPEIVRALALDPTNIFANMIDAAVKKAVTTEAAQTIVAAHPDDWRAWWLAWRAAKTGAESREARDKTCTLLEANPAAAPIEACTRAASGAFAEDPRRVVFMAATPQLNECLKKAKRAENFTIDLEIADSGVVTAARVSIGTPEVNACAEEVLKKLAFPTHHAGTFHIGH